MALTGNGTPDVYKILGSARTRQDYDYSYMNRDINENQEDLYVGHGGDPWSASSADIIYNKGIHGRIVSSSNMTANNTRPRSA